MIRTGEDYRNSINDGRDVWINGARVDDPCSHPQLKPIIDVRARIYDMQHAAETQEAMTYEERVGVCVPALTRPIFTIVDTGRSKSENVEHGESNI